MPIHQFHRGSPRRKIENKMLAKVLVFSVALAAASCQEYKAHHYYAPQEQRQYVEFVPVSSHHQPAPIYEAQSSEVQGHGHEQEISQNAIQYSHSQQGSEGAQEHYQPLYQYVKTEPESPSHHYPAPEHQQTHAIQVHNQLSHDEHSHYPAHEPARHYPHHVESHDAPHQHQQLKESYDSHEKPIDYYAYPKYQYEYKVEDPHTGDNKYQHEVRDGDMVKGVYSLQEADGSIRTVEYSSDKHNGFTAVVKHSAPGQHVEFQSHHKH